MRSLGVSDMYPLLLDRRAIYSQNELLCCRGEVYEARYGKIFVVKVWVFA